MRTPGTAVGARSPLAAAPLRAARRGAAPRAANAPGPRHALRQQALPHRLPARARHPLPRGPLPVRGRRLHRAPPGRGAAHRPDPGPGVRLARTPVADAAVDLPGPVRRRELAGPDGGVPPGVRGAAGRRAEGTRADGARQVPRPRSADVRARTGVARRRLPARVVGAHAGASRGVRRRRLGAQPGRSRPPDRAGRPGLPGAPRSPPAAGARGPPGPPVPAVRPRRGRHARMVGRRPAGLPGAVAGPAGAGAAPRRRRGTAAGRAGHPVAAAPARAVRAGGAGGAGDGGRGVAAPGRRGRGGPRREPAARAVRGRPGADETAGSAGAGGSAGHGDPAGHGGSADSSGPWSAETAVDLLALAASGVGTWDLRLRIRFRDGASRDVTAHALTGAGLLRRRAVPSARHCVVLVQPYTTHSGALALRVAPGVRGVLSVVRARLRRLLH